MNFTILCTHADGHTETVVVEHSLGRYATLQAKKQTGAKAAKIIDRRESHAAKPAHKNSLYCECGTFLANPIHDRPLPV
jgi:hypothetical protein